MTMYLFSEISFKGLLNCRIDLFFFYFTSTIGPSTGLAVSLLPTVSRALNFFPFTFRGGYQTQSLGLLGKHFILNYKSHP